MCIKRCLYAHRSALLSQRKLETTLKSANSKRTMVFSNNGMLFGNERNNLAIGNKKWLYILINCWSNDTGDTEECALLLVRIKLFMKFKICCKRKNHEPEAVWWWLKGCLKKVSWGGLVASNVLNLGLGGICNFCSPMTINMYFSIFRIIIEMSLGRGRNISGSWD